ncbi:hypothetical protein ACV3RL_16470 [Clostridium perfringens]
MSESLADEYSRKVLEISKKFINELEGELKMGKFDKNKLNNALKKDLSNREKLYKAMGKKMPVRERLSLISKYNGIEKQARKELPQLFKVATKVATKGLGGIEKML